MKATAKTAALLLLVASATFSVNARTFTSGGAGKGAAGEAGCAGVRAHPTPAAVAPIECWTTSRTPAFQPARCTRELVVAISLSRTERMQSNAGR
jgi:hypothetical protein